MLDRRIHTRDVRLGRNSCWSNSADCALGVVSVQFSVMDPNAENGPLELKMEKPTNEH